MTRPKGLAVLLALALPALARAGESPVAILDQIGIDENLAAGLPQDVELRDASGNPLRLGEALGERPVLLALIYYRCPMLCGESLDGLARAMRAIRLELGHDFDVVTVSIDPEDGPEEAAVQKRSYLAKLGGEPPNEAVRFLTGNAASIEALTDAVGFRYVEGGLPGQFAHASGLVVVTPEGKVSRYFYGIDYAARDLQFALMEAADERIGSPVDQVLLYCYQYDPATGRYGFVILNALRIAGVLTVAALSVFVGVSLRRERARVERA